MTLEYSIGRISPVWYRGGLPYSDMHTEKVKVFISGSTTTGPFPPVFTEGDLLCYRRLKSDESAVVLLLEYHHGNNPSISEPVQFGEWAPVPGAPIIGQIRVALTPEAIKQIKQVAGEDCRYEVSLIGVNFINKTPRLAGSV